MKPDFWDDSEKAQEIFDILKSKKGDVEEYDSLVEALEEIHIMMELAGEEESSEYDGEIEKIIEEAEEKLEKLKISTLLSGEFDGNNAIMMIHAGAGGMEAQDWAGMLLRMYHRWVEDHDFTMTLREMNSDDENGIKSCTLFIKGHNAYGLLKGEKGVHRLVRISPFDTNSRRHTSFASVNVFPEIINDTEVEINPSDLKIDTYRASGAGGQHVNTTDSAVRITHIPTGVTVQCQSERSQIFNRETAMNMLKARLLLIKEEEKRERIEDIQGKYSQISWGSQIRSYVFQPYTLVKDHRSNYETGNAEKVIDGNIDPIINAYLKELNNSK